MQSVFATEIYTIEDACVSVRPRLAAWALEGKGSVGLWRRSSLKPVKDGMAEGPPLIGLGLCWPPVQRC